MNCSVMCVNFPFLIFGVNQNTKSSTLIYSFLCMMAANDSHLRLYITYILHSCS